MKSKLRDIAVSALALAVIGGMVTAALAATNELTKGTIAQRSAETEDAARRQVIDADSFDQAALSLDGEEVTYYVAVRDGETAGYVFTASVTGKSAGLVVMTGISADGSITGVAVTEENETAGYVDKVIEGGLLDRLTGRQAQTLTLGEDVDGVSQATRTSRGIVDGVNQAIDWYNQLTKGGGTP